MIQAASIAGFAILVSLAVGFGTGVRHQKSVHQAQADAALVQSTAHARAQEARHAEQVQTVHDTYSASVARIRADAAVPVARLRVCPGTAHRPDAGASSSGADDSASREAVWFAARQGRIDAATTELVSIGQELDEERARVLALQGVVLAVRAACQ